MDDTVNVVRSHSDGLTQPALTAVTTKASRRRGDDATNGDGKVPERKQSDAVHTVTTPNTPEDALNFLRSEPSTDALLATLNKLSSATNGYPAFSLVVPGPLQSRILNVLLSSIIPTFWPTLSAIGDRKLVVACLFNITGLDGVVSSIRSLTNNPLEKVNVGLAQCLFEVLELLLHYGEAETHAELTDGARRHGGAPPISYRQHRFVAGLWHNQQSALATDIIKRELSWKQAINLLASGKIVSAVASAEDALRTANALKKRSWFGDGKDHAHWLGRNLAFFLREEAGGLDDQQDGRRSDAGAMLARFMNMGYPSATMYGLFNEPMDLDVVSVMDALPAHARRRFLELVLRWLSGLAATPPDLTSRSVDKAAPEISAMAAFFASPAPQATMHELIGSILSDPVLTTCLSHPVRRASIAALGLAPDCSDTLRSLLESLMTTFSDHLFISHGPLLQQEAITKTLLLTAGYLHRQEPMAVLRIARSSKHLQGTSSRLDASSQRARWLGMVVATAISTLVDKEGSRMEFGTDEMQSEEARWYLGLVEVKDEVGRLDEFARLLERANDGNTRTSKPKRQLLPKPEKAATLNGKPRFGPPRPPVVVPTQTEVVGEKVTELFDEVSDDDLKPYAKPDSDPDDSDEDATLVNRNKSRPPVYVRDLMSMLRDDKKVDRFQLGVKHAAALVRRKASFGNEVKDHAVELMSLLSNLQDPFETEDFDETRLQAMIAVLLTDTITLGPWLSRHCFVEGYSIAQRCLMLSALGLGGRELAGFKDEDELNPVIPCTKFPSKKLPARLHAMYTPAAPATKRLEGASRALEDQMMQPMALKAADQSTKHLNAVKVRTFSSRLSDTERTKRRRPPNQLAKVFGQAIFFPLAHRYQQDLAAYGCSSVFSSSPLVLVIFLKTLALLLHASGPATLNLADITTAFWDLLSSLRAQASSDISVLEAVLFSLLTLLEVNTTSDSGARRLAKDERRRLMEAQQWVEVVFERAGGGGFEAGGGEEEDKVRALAAGVLVKCREVVEIYQKELFGRVIE